MDHSVAAYIRRMPTEKLEKFLKECEGNGQLDAYRQVVLQIREELERRKNKTEISIFP